MTKPLFYVRADMRGTAVALVSGQLHVYVSRTLDAVSADQMAKELNDVCAKWDRPETDKEKAARYRRTLERILQEGADPIATAKEALEDP